MGQVHSVIGIGYGDEGKGIVVDYLCSKEPNPIVIRHSGGHQVGHTVKLGDFIHEFHSFGSGTLRGVPTVWGPPCTIFPTVYMLEYNLLDKNGHTPEFYCYPVNPITTPYDVAYNRAYNRKLGATNSVGIGFSSTLIRYEVCPLKVLDLKYPETLDAKYKAVADYYYKKTVEEGLEELFLEELYNAPGYYTFKDDCREFLQCSTIIDETFDFAKYDTLIFEGNQGVLLDMYTGFYPNITHGVTTNAGLMRWIPHTMAINKWYVTRAYATRHGDGVLHYEDKKLSLKNTEYESNHENPYQGKFRYAPLVANLINYAITADKLSYSIVANTTNIVVTCVDQLQDSNKIPIVIDEEFEEVSLEFFRGFADNVYKNTSPESSTIEIVL